jgi:hypothetical protein
MIAQFRSRQIQHKNGISLQLNVLLLQLSEIDAAYGLAGCDHYRFEIRLVVVEVQRWPNRSVWPG